MDCLFVLTAIWTYFHYGKLISSLVISMSNLSRDRRSLHRIWTISSKQTTTIDLLIYSETCLVFSWPNVFSAQLVYCFYQMKIMRKQYYMKRVPNFRRNHYHESNAVCFCIYITGKSRCCSLSRTTKQQTYSFTFFANNFTYEFFVWHVRLV